MRIWVQRSASIQPRTSSVKFDIPRAIHLIQHLSREQLRLGEVQRGPELEALLRRGLEHREGRARRALAALPRP